MTRLKTEDISHIKASLDKYNRDLIVKTGATLGQIAAYAAETGEEKVCRNFKVAVIPFTCGRGIIEGFTQAVASITGFLGFNSFVTENTDAGGVAEAVEKGAEILMMADDDKFVAINRVTARVSDNGEATGRGYAAALDLMAGGLRNRNVLILGAGPVGKGAALALAKLGAKISIFDIKPRCSNRLAEEVHEKTGITVRTEGNLDRALLVNKIIYDATPAPSFIHKRHITPDTFIAAPGIPLGVDSEALPEVADRLLHDPLEIGVATMIYDVCKQA
ncbi:3-methylornithyl-N6-L-lysine dehydrogenase PylD [Thermincola ferriacetica]